MTADFEPHRSYRFKCPICGMMGYTNSWYRIIKLDIIKSESLGDKKGFSYTSVNPYSIPKAWLKDFQEKFANVVLDLLKWGLIDEDLIRQVIGLRHTSVRTPPSPSYDFKPKEVKVYAKGYDFKTRT